MLMDMSAQRSTLGDALDPTRNSLNFLRLVLALAVLVSNACSIGGWGSGAWFGGTALGTVAVCGFFGISGYLVAGSAERNSSARYLWQRCLRILPGYWVALVVTAVVFGYLGWKAQHLPGNYFHASPSPWSFIGNNFFLDYRQILIGSATWNGSIWTLFYEFLCYLVVMVLARLKILQARTEIFIAAAAVWLLQIVVTFWPHNERTFNPLHFWIPEYLIKFLAIFLVGSALYTWRHHVVDSGWIALACGLAFFGNLYMGGSLPYLYFRVSDLGAPLLAYPLLWLGAHLPFHRVGARNDYSYGVYIYAFPVTTLLTYTGASQMGYFAFSYAAIACTVPLAVASWWLVERPAQKLKRARWPRRSTTVTS